MNLALNKNLRETTAFESSSIDEAICGKQSNGFQQVYIQTPKPGTCSLVCKCKGPEKLKVENSLKNLKSLTSREQAR